MAVVGKKTTNFWKNNDGLSVFFGTQEGTSDASGEYRTDGPRRMVEVVIDLDSLETQASGKQQIQSDTVTLPAGAIIEQVDVLVTEETAGTNANLDVGLVKLDRSTEIDFNGLLAAADAFNAGTDLGTLTSYVVGTTEAGALIGTKLAYTGYITAAPETADWTAGVVKVRVYYSFPVASDLSA